MGARKRPRANKIVVVEIPRGANETMREDIEPVPGCPLEQTMRRGTCSWYFLNSNLASPDADNEVRGKDYHALCVKCQIGAANRLALAEGISVAAAQEKLAAKAARRRRIANEPR